MLPSRLSPLPHWASPASFQRDSGFPTELAAARHPGPCPGNATWFLRHLLLAPGYHPEEQRYGAHRSPGAQPKGSGRAPDPAPQPQAPPAKQVTTSACGPNAVGCPSPLLEGMAWPSPLVGACSPTNGAVTYTSIQRLIRMQGCSSKNPNTAYMSVSGVPVKLVVVMPTVGHNVVITTRETWTCRWRVEQIRFRSPLSHAVG